MELQGLPDVDIGKWIQVVRGISLPMIPDLKRIKENSAGLPILLEEWIRTSADCKDHETINREELCNQITKLKDGLSSDMEKSLYRLSILQQPFSDDEILASYLEISDLFSLHPFIEKLIENRIFYPLVKNNSKNYTDSWFKNDLIKRCFEDDLGNSLNRQYHDLAAKFFIELQKNNMERTTGLEEKDEQYHDNSDHDDNGNLQTQDGYKIAISAAYHLHMSKRSLESLKESYRRNNEIGRYASSIGDLDLAERCYKRAIDDSEHIEGFEDKKMNLILDLTNYVFVVWGRYEDAGDNYQLLLKYYSDVKNDQGRANVLSSIAKMHYMKRDYVKALKVLDDQMQIEQQSGNEYSIAAVNHMRATIYEDREEYDEALKIYKENLSIWKQASNQPGGSTTNIQLYLYSSLYNIANILRIRGEYDEALSHLKESLSIAKQASNQLGVSETLHGMASVYYYTGDYDKALEAYKERLSIEKQLGNQSGMTFTLWNMGKVLLKQKKDDEAINCTSEAHRILQDLNLPDAKISSARFRKY